MLAQSNIPSRRLIPDAPTPSGPSAGGVGNIGGVDPGAWWDPRNWSAGGQKLLPGANVASAPKNTNPYYASTPRAQSGLAPANQPQLGKSTSDTTEKDKADARQKALDDFFEELNKPLDMNDPYVKNILMNARNTTMQSANDAGIFGPYSQNLAEQAYIKGAAGLQDAKQQRALQALGMATGQFNNQRDFNYDVAKDKYTNDMDIWKFKQGQASGFGGMVGGGLGAIGGGIVGGPAGAAAGWQLGSGIGSSIGGNSGGPPPTFHYGGGGQ